MPHGGLCLFTQIDGCKLSIAECSTKTKMKFISKIKYVWEFHSNVELANFVPLSLLQYSVDVLAVIVSASEIVIWQFTRLKENVTFRSLTKTYWKDYIQAHCWNNNSPTFEKKNVWENIRIRYFVIISFTPASNSGM